MILYRNNGVLIEAAHELPELPERIETLYADFEAGSGDDNVAAFSPWKNSYPAGIAVTWDEHPKAYYVPIGHYRGGNLAFDAVRDWWFHVLSRSTRWVNSNVKFDAHLSEQCMGVEFHGRLTDTATQAKLVDSDRFTYGLKQLSKDWLRDDIGWAENAMAPYLKNTKDWAWVPADVMGEYACQDVLSNRKLWHYILSRMPERSYGVSEVEDRVTRALYLLEKRGTCVNIDELRFIELQLTEKLIELSLQLQAKVGYIFRPDNNDDCMAVLCGTYTLPVLGWTEAGDPSFSAPVLKDYLLYPDAPVDVINLILEYRIAATRLGLFIKPWMEVQVDGLLRPDYNQAVRTGRMSCRRPNKQQLDKWVKQFIHPRPGYGFICADASQVEFRVIAHYINARNCIEAYNADPDTDFHQWVADECGIPRRPAKNVNFCIGYGGGKNRLVSMLTGQMELMASLQEQFPDPVAFRAACQAKALSVYQAYHDTLPTLKSISNEAARRCRSRGFVFNIAGRERRLPMKVAHKAFNNLCQSTAADLMKERLAALSEAFQDVPELDLHIVDVVHDEFVIEAPLWLLNDEPRRERLLDTIVNILEHSTYELSVPIRYSISWGVESWYAAGQGSTTRERLPANSLSLSQLVNVNDSY